MTKEGVGGKGGWEDGRGGWEGQMGGWEDGGGTGASNFFPTLPLLC
jgi:hypothetical protein